MNISGINGAEQYIYNKMNYLDKQGYEVYIFSARPGKIIINGFKKYENLINPTLRFYPFCIKKSELAEVLDWINSVVNIKNEDIVTIESSNVTSALWGELLASKLKCKHLAMIMQENHNYNKYMREFLTFKLNQHELSGIFDDSVQKMLKNPKLETREDMHVRAFCNNSVQDCEDDFSGLLSKDADLTFGSIGRLEKEYVMPLVENLAEYFNKHKDKKFNLLLVGGSANKQRIKNIKTVLQNCSNVNLIITGAIYPIPKKLIKNVDLFVSAAGSAAVSYYEKIPTVKIHHVTAESMGIIGVDFQITEKPTITNEPDKTIDSCINRILNGDPKINFVDDFEDFYYQRMYAEFSRQLSLGDNVETRNYYNVFDVKYTDFKYKICALFCRFIGVKNSYSCLEFLRKLIRGTD